MHPCTFWFGLSILWHHPCLHVSFVVLASLWSRFLSSPARIATSNVLSFQSFIEPANAILLIFLCLRYFITSLIYQCRILQLMSFSYFSWPHYNNCKLFVDTPVKPCIHPIWTKCVTNLCLPISITLVSGCSIFWKAFHWLLAMVRQVIVFFL